MAKQKTSKSNLKKIEKEDAQKKDFKVREGQENNSILSDEKPPQKNDYPRTTAQDKQSANQTEYIQRDNNQSKNSK